LLVNENQTPLEVLSIVKNSNGSFPNINVMLRILLTIPVTPASAERSFSKLKIIKNYICNKISQEKLSGLSMISIEKAMSDTINYGKIIDYFAAAKFRKNHFNYTKQCMYTFDILYILLKTKYKYPLIIFILL